MGTTISSINFFQGWTYRFAELMRWRLFLTERYIHFPSPSWGIRTRNRRGKENLEEENHPSEMIDFSYLEHILPLLTNFVLDILCWTLEEWFKMLTYPFLTTHCSWVKQVSSPAWHHPSVFMVCSQLEILSIRERSERKQQLSFCCRKTFTRPASDFMPLAHKCTLPSWPNQWPERVKRAGRKAM